MSEYGLKINDTMSLETPVGEKVVFTGTGGYDSERLNAMRHLTVGESYTVSKINVGKWTSGVAFEETGDDIFNTVMFANEKPSGSISSRLACAKEKYDSDPSGFNKYRYQETVAAAFSAREIILKEEHAVAVDELKNELKEALQIIYNLGGREYVKYNYPNEYSEFCANEKKDN